MKRKITLMMKLREVMMKSSFIDGAFVMDFVLDARWKILITL